MLKIKLLSQPARYILLYLKQQDGHVAQLDRATVSGTVGRGFDSYRDHHN